MFLIPSALGIGFIIGAITTAIFDTVVNITMGILDDVVLHIKNIK